MLDTFRTSTDSLNDGGKGSRKDGRWSECQTRDPLKISVAHSASQKKFTSGGMRLAIIAILVKLRLESHLSTNHRTPGLFDVLHWQQG